MNTSIMQDMTEIQELANEILEDEPIECGHCGSDNTEFDTVTQQNWCNDCWRWFKDESESDSESRDDIADRENRILDRL